METTFNLVPYYRDLLVKAVPENSSSVGHCVLKGWLHNLGNTLGFDSMRLFLYNDKGNNIIINHVYGDREIWQEVDISRFRKEKTKYKKLFFVKIRHIRENGQFLTLGYLAFHTELYVTDDLLSSLDILCMLYGNYIVKRLAAGQFARINKLLPNTYSIAASNGLPGTKIIKILDSLQKLAGFNYGLFCTVINESVVAEYLAKQNKCLCLNRHKEWHVPRSFIDLIINSPKDHWYKLSEFPPNIINFILHRDRRYSFDFSVQTFPVCVDGELVGLWLFIYSENNPYVNFGTHNTLDGTYSLLLDSYRFLFQRRFGSMIVNPIFQNRDTRVINDLVFIIMPFTQDWSKDIWEQVIKPAVQEMGMNPVRADDLYGQNIMEDVWQSILKASIIICDTTGRNPNVFYELGIAHTLGKKVLLLTQSVADIPFDLHAYRHIEYKVSISGGNKLKETIKKHIKEILSNK